jgi:UDP-N-acetylmuramate--alanine ligase
MRAAAAADSILLLAHGDPRPVHFVGIAGAGMSALAELFVRRGVNVTGCDQHTASAGDLRRLGVPLYTGHDPHHVELARAVVVSSAIPRDAAEVQRARALGIPVIRRAEALGYATRGGTLVAIAGTHGKTTTTAMTTDALTAAGLAPTGIAGGRMAAWDGNLRWGSDRLFVVEADEYDRSFLALAPTIAVITNIEADHLDIYADLDDIRDAFALFASDSPAVVVCADDPGAATLPLSDAADVVTYGLTGANTRIRGTDVHAEGGGQRFLVSVDGAPGAGVTLVVPGLHNVRNALAAIASGIVLGASVEGMGAGLAAFRGVERRFQRLGARRGVEVVDDYAHHPTEIRAAVAAARAAYPGRRLVAAFQPHLFSRTRDFAADFGAALALADVAYLTEIYPAREAPMPGVTSTLIADAVRAAGGTMRWQGPRDELADVLVREVHDGDVVLTMGAGDITTTGPELLARLERGP